MLRNSDNGKMTYWVMKSEPEECSIDDLWRLPDQRIQWTGVRNYQARNFMMKDMQIGDEAFFYHSSCATPGIAGIVTIITSAYPDTTQFDKSSPYFEAKASVDKPRWFGVDVKWQGACELIDLPTLRAQEKLVDMRLLQRGNRLSITPLSDAHWKFIIGRCYKKRAPVTPKK